MKENKANYYKKPRKLPFKFNINNYAGANKLDAKGWLYQLLLRQCIKINMNPPMSFVDEDLKAIKQYGIVPKPAEKDKPKNSYENCLEDQILNEFQKPPVRFITRAEAYRFSTILESDNKEKSLNEEFGGKHLRPTLADALSPNASRFHSEEAKKFYNQPFDDFIRGKKPTFSNPFNPIFNSNHIHLTIDLSASDEQINSIFTELLKQARNKLNKYKNTKQQKCLKKLMEGKFTETVLKQFARSNALAYIDLNLLAEFHGIKLTRNQVVSALNCGNGRSILDDKIKPWADVLMDSELLIKLNVFANKPKYRKKIKKKK